MSRQAAWELLTERPDRALGMIEVFAEWVELLQEEQPALLQAVATPAARQWVTLQIGRLCLPG